MKRAMMKAVTWRCMASLTTAALTYAATGSMDTALAVGCLDTIIKLGLYVAHEKAWERV